MRNSTGCQSSLHRDKPGGETRTSAAAWPMAVHSAPRLANKTDSDFRAFFSIPVLRIVARSFARAISGYANVSACTAVMDWAGLCRALGWIVDGRGLPDRIYFKERTTAPAVGQDSDPDRFKRVRTKS